MTTTPLQMIGNEKLLDLPGKVAFLSSRHISASVFFKCYDWATGIRDTAQCVISGFQSLLEKGVLKFLLRGNVPIVLVLARRLWKVIPDELHNAMEERRLLIVSPVTSQRASAVTVAFRNRWILANCDTLVIGSLDPSGELAKLVSKFDAERLKRLDRG